MPPTLSHSLGGDRQNLGINKFPAVNACPAFGVGITTGFVLSWVGGHRLCLKDKASDPTGHRTKPMRGGGLAISRVAPCNKSPNCKLVGQTDLSIISRSTEFLTNQQCHPPPGPVLKMFSPVWSMDPGFPNHLFDPQLPTGPSYPSKKPLDEGKPYPPALPLSPL